jgi:DUF971 family protein
MEPATLLTFEPEHITVSKSKGIRIDWRDGHHSEYGLQYLRDHCPCAQCTGAHGTVPGREDTASPFQMFKPVLAIAEVEAVGSYALRLKWSDGHSTGIYSWEHLRRICPCAECAAAAS